MCFCGDSPLISELLLVGTWSGSIRRCLWAPLGPPATATLARWTPLIVAPQRHSTTKTLPLHRPIAASRVKILQKSEHQLFSWTQDATLETFHKNLGDKPSHFVISKLNKSRTTQREEFALKRLWWTCTECGLQMTLTDYHLSLI